MIDGEQLAQYMLDFGIGVAEVASYKVQRVDLDYFGEGRAATIQLASIEYTQPEIR